MYIQCVTLPILEKRRKIEKREKEKERKKRKRERDREREKERERDSEKGRCALAPSCLVCEYTNKT